MMSEHTAEELHEMLSSIYHAEAKELIAGFAIIDVNSKEEAIEWATRFANVIGEVEIEIRQVVEVSDFPPENVSPETAAREQARREELQRKAAQP